MATQWFQYPNGRANPSINTNPWKWYQSSGTDPDLSYSASDGIRFQAHVQSVGNELRADWGPGWSTGYQFTTFTMPASKYTVSGIKIKRNSPNGYITRIRFETQVGATVYRTDVPSTAYSRTPQGVWISIPNVDLDITTNSGTLQGIVISFSPGADFNVKGFNYYRTTEAPVGAVLGADDANFVASTYEADLWADFEWQNPNDLVQKLTWNWGDGSPEQSGVVNDTDDVSSKSHVFPTAGTYSVKLKAQNYKTSTAPSPITSIDQSYTKIIQVKVPSGPYEARYTQQTSYLTAQFDGSSSVGDLIETYSWDFGDGFTATGAIQSHTYAVSGGYPVALTITNSLGESHTLTKTVSVEGVAVPNIDFTAARELLSVAFQPNIFNGTYLWSFGDGTNSTAQNPIHLYATPGTYLVSLQHTPQGGGTATNVSHNITVNSVYGEVTAWTDRLRLEIEQPPVEGEVYNRLENPDGEFGGFDWITYSTTGKISGSNTTTRPDDHYIEGWKLIYSSDGGGVEDQFFGTSVIQVTPGQYISASWVVPYIQGAYRQSFFFYNESNVLVSQSTPTPYLQATNTPFQSAVVVVPATAVRVISVWYHYDNIAGAKVSTRKVMHLRNVMVSVHNDSAALANLTYIANQNWVNIMGDSFDIKISRRELNIGVMNVLIRGSNYDPSKHDVIRPGQGVRLRASVEDTFGDEHWESVYTGEALNAQSNYDRPRVIEGPGGFETIPDPDRTVVTILAIDNITNIASTPKKSGVAEIYELPILFEGVRVPYIINGSSDQITSYQVTSYNENAKLIDQIAITRDTNKGYAFVDRNNVFVAYDPEQQPTDIKTIIDEADYSDIEVGFDTDKCINSVVIKFLRYIPATGIPGTENYVAAQTIEVDYGPYKDQASIDEWGFHEKEFKIQGVVENPTFIATYASEILELMKTPAVTVSKVELPIVNTRDINEKAILDLYDLIQLRYSNSNIDSAVRITEIDHRINLTGWKVDLGFTRDGAVASPQKTPEPPAVDTQQEVTEAMCAMFQEGVGQSVTSGVTTAVRLDTAEFDVGDMADVANNRIVVPTDGIYRVTGMISFATGTTGVRQTAIRINGVEYITTRINASVAGGTYGVQCTDLLVLGEGEYVTMVALHTQGSSLVLQTTSESWTRLSVELVKVL